MPTLHITAFAGEVPRTTPRLLENNQASQAVNCRLERGALEALPGPKRTADLAASAQTLFKHPVDGWLSWPGVVNVVKSAIADVNGETPLGHLFLTGEKPYPTQYLAGGRQYRLGIPRPLTAPTVSLAAGAGGNTVLAYAFGAETETDFPPRYGYEDALETLREDNVQVEAFAETVSDGTNVSTDSGISRSSAYCYTLVRSLADGLIQQESAPSPPSVVLNVPDGDGVLLSGFAVPEDDDLHVTHIRIYRTLSGTESSEFHFLTELPLPVTSYLDTTPDVALSAEVLVTSTWDPLPDDAQGLIYADNGIYAAFRGNELLLSEPFYAYAFPTDYRLTTADPIVALGHVDATIAVLTTGRPYLVSGSEPGSMQMLHLPIEQACVAPRSVGSLPGGIIYASPDGLMLFTSSEQTLLTGQTFTREQWQTLNPETLLGTVHDNRYVGFFAGTNRGFLFNVGARDVVWMELPESWAVQAVYHHSQDDCVYLSVDTDQGSGIEELEAGAPLPYRWRSRPFFTSALCGMAAVRIEGEQDAGNPIQVFVYGPDSGQIRAVLSLRDTVTRRLPTTRAEKVWSLELQGTATLFEARMGTAVEDLEYGQ